MPEYAKPLFEVFALDHANFGNCLSPCEATALGFPLRDFISVDVVPNKPTAVGTQNAMLIDYVFSTGPMTTRRRKDGYLNQLKTRRPNILCSPTARIGRGLLYVSRAKRHISYLVGDIAGYHRGM
jgi:hypothetical protein